MEISEVLRNKRQEKSITQSDLAKSIGVSARSISNWESGRTTPDLESIIQLANLYNLSLDELFSEDPKLVKNIDNKSEIRQTRIYSFCALITDLIFLFIIIASRIIKQELPMIILIPLVIGIVSNFLVIIYFNDRQNSLYYQSKSDVKKANLKQAIWGIAIAIVILLVLNLVLLFSPR